MILMLITVRCGYWMIEQPSSSKLLLNPELGFLLNLMTKFVEEANFTRLRLAQK